MPNGNTVIAFAGRLSDEKWFAEAVSIFEGLRDQGLAVTMLVSGDGPLRSILQGRDDTVFVQDALSETLFSSLRAGAIYAFGWRSEPDMRAIMQRADYCLLPSRFIETFGLGALESLRVGTPVIGPRLGGLCAFIPETLAIDLSIPFADTVARVHTIIKNHIGLDEDSLKRQSAIVANHTQEAWLHAVAERLLQGKNDKKILFVSDYDAPIGGVERHIEAIRDVLSVAGNTVRTIGKIPQSIPLGRLEKARDMLGTFGVGWGNSILRQTLADFAPDILWVHSFTKVYDARAIHMLAEHTGHKVFTYHDFSLFTAFASRMRSLSDVPDSWTYRDYISTISHPSMAERAYLWLKFRKISMIQRSLSHYDTHIVPSEFMVEFVERFIGVPRSRILVLPHFLPPR